MCVCVCVCVSETEREREREREKERERERERENAPQTCLLKNRAAQKLSLPESKTGSVRKKSVIRAFVIRADVINLLHQRLAQK